MDYFKASVIQGLIATSGLKAKGFFRNLRISLKEKEKKKRKKRYYLPLVAIGAQKTGQYQIVKSYLL